MEFSSVLMRYGAFRNNWQKKSFQPVIRAVPIAVLMILYVVFHWNIAMQGMSITSLEPVLLIASTPAGRLLPNVAMTLSRRKGNTEQHNPMDRVIYCRM